MKPVVLFNPDAWNIFVGVQHSLDLQWKVFEQRLDPVYDMMDSINVGLTRHLKLRSYPPWLYGTYPWALPRQRADHAQRKANK